MSLTWSRSRWLMALCCFSFLPLLISMPATARLQEEAKPVAVRVAPEAPEGAVVLFAGKGDEIGANWFKRGSTDPAPWVLTPEGAMTPRSGDITSKAEFGDCMIHVEFRPTVDAEGKTKGHGNAGVGIAGRYEIQIMDSYRAEPSVGGCGAMYSQKPPRVNVSKKAGEWQSFEIIFRAPRFDDQGKVVEKARATVLQNGVVIHNNAEFAGPTGIQYGEFAGEAPKGPIVLQGDHDPVEFRNIWVIPL
ncbi:MAG: DUF1080 domain-containing protein [Chthonomonadales bacterium]|nr:DUF1080 domain-containing protein [Chthonomonadales bacterium]